MEGTLLLHIGLRRERVGFSYAPAWRKRAPWLKVPCESVKTGSAQETLSAIL